MKHLKSEKNDWHWQGAFKPTGSTDGGASWSKLMHPNENFPWRLSADLSESKCGNYFRIYFIEDCVIPTHAVSQERSKQEEGKVHKWNMIPLCKGIFCRQWPICFWCHKKPGFFHPLPNMSAVSLSFYVSACLIITSSGHSKYFTTNYKVFWRQNFPGEK